LVVEVLEQLEAVAQEAPVAIPYLQEHQPLPLMVAVEAVQEMFLAVTVAPVVVEVAEVLPRMAVLRQETTLLLAVMVRQAHLTMEQVVVAVLLLSVQMELELLVVMVVLVSLYLI